MKVLFSADYHIKLGTKNIPEDWAKNRFRMLFSEVHRLEKDVDLSIVGGDFFDKLPSLEELELYYEFVLGCKIETIIIPGNHEALKKGTTFLSFLKSITTKLNPLVRVVDDFYTYKSIDFIPYNKLKEFEKGTKYTFNENILVTHVRGEIPPHVKPEIDLSLFDKWNIVLAGDLHSYDNCQGNIIYPGSPITTSFHRSMVDTGVIIFNTTTLLHDFIKLELPQLIRKNIRAGDPMPSSNYHHTIYEVEGDLDELSKVEDSSLLDKKITKRSQDYTLILDSKMTIQEEVTEYLKFILELPDDKIINILAELNDHTKKIGME